MQFWNNIIQTIMLGTDKKQIGVDELPEDFTAVVSAVSNNEAIDREEKFLQIVSLACNYRRSGAVPLHRGQLDMPVAPAEDRPYCNPFASQTLKDILDEDNTRLLALWLQLCESRGQIVPPRFLPILLDKATQQKALQPAIEKCGGHRGKWLSQFNEDWSFAAEIPDEELWLTGTTEQRKQVLEKLRLQNAATAREWLEQTWEQENANTKASLLRVMSVNLSAGDTAWLENLVDDKSKKVKEEALELLKQLPGSSIVQKYWQVLKQAVILTTEKAMLGMRSRSVVRIQLPDVVDESLFKTGIEKLSNRKEFSDEELIIYQLIARVPPALWKEHMKATPEDIIALFQNDESHKKYVPAFVLALVQFGDREWAHAFAENKQVFYIDILPLLPLQQQDYYSSMFFSGNENAIIELALKSKAEWSVELTKNIFTYAAINFYHYNHLFYKRAIHLIPVQIADTLEQCAPKDEYQRSVWKNTSDYIHMLIQLKSRTIQAFNNI